MSLPGETEEVVDVFALDLALQLAGIFLEQLRRTIDDGLLAGQPRPESVSIGQVVAMRKAIDLIACEISRHRRRRSTRQGSEGRFTATTPGNFRDCSGWLRADEASRH